MNFLELALGKVTMSEICLVVLAIIVISSFSIMEQSNNILQSDNLSLINAVKNAERLALDTLSQNKRIIHQNENLVEQNKLASEVIGFLEKKIGKPLDEIYRKCDES